MTMSAFAQELGGWLPSANERAAANQLRTIIAAQAAGNATLRVLDDKKPAEVTLTPALSGLLYGAAPACGARRCSDFIGSEDAHNSAGG